jgi:GMP synthase (glutamine-hydrolysing)
MSYKIHPLPNPPPRSRGGDIDKILILDFGSQYTQLIVRRIREVGVYAELHLCDVSADFIRTFNPKGIILSGSPESTLAAEPLTAPAFIFNLGIPILGICYGLQTMAIQLGGSVEKGASREFGLAELTVLKPNPLFGKLTGTLSVWMSHGDRVKQLPPGFETIAQSAHAPIAAMMDVKRQLYALQFHPEVTHTPQGQHILASFVHDICGCDASWTTENILNTLIQDIRTQVGKEEVILGLSGGVDSSVLAALLHKAIGSQLHCIFVDTGLLRLGEADEVMTAFSNYSLQKIEAAPIFYKALAGLIDPEQKRKAVGQAFITVFEQAALQQTQAAWLAQGTIYPDVIESGGGSSGKAKVIKSHHNVGGLPKTLSFNLLEPLKELFKDEVRQLGERLGVPHSRLYRHPFPGPGLCVRILEEVKPEFVTLLQKADYIFIELLHQYHWYTRVSQAFAVFLPIQSVGVMGDERRYEYVIALRAVETVDFMTARAADLPFALLQDAARRIVNEVPGIARVVYDVSDKPPATIEWE